MAWKEIKFVYLFVLLFVIRRRRSLDPNKLRRSQAPRSTTNLLPLGSTSFPLPKSECVSVAGGDPHEEEGTNRGGRNRMTLTPENPIRRLPPSLGHGEAGQEGGSDRAGSPITDELSELLNDSSIERHLSGCAAQSPTRGSHKPRACLHTPTFEHQEPFFSSSPLAPEGQPVTNLKDRARTGGHLTFEPTTSDSNKSDCTPMQAPPSSSSPLPFDLDSLALQVRDRISSIFDQPPPMTEVSIAVVPCLI